MMICAIASAVLRWLPSRKAAKSLVMTLAEASDSQACANSVSLLMPGEMENMGLGLRGGLGVGLNMAMLLE
ncbi:hypothetical protein D3C76_1489840 [compost metagenome]